MKSYIVVLKLKKTSIMKIQSITLLNIEYPSEFSSVSGANAISTGKIKQIQSERKIMKMSHLIRKLLYSWIRKSLVYHHYLNLRNRVEVSPSLG